MEEKPAKQNCSRITTKMPVTTGYLSNQEYWESFFTSEGADDFTEWYADWPQLRTLIRNHLSFPQSAPPPEELSILVPACGNSRLSEHLYDEGFRKITNVDYSKVVISAMLRRNVRERSEMKWRVMDMICMQFANGTFDAIIDKAGLDAMLGPVTGKLYISEVKRLLKAGGRYICLTLAESHELGLLFSKFRFGWKINLYTVAQEASPGTTKQQIFMFVAEKTSLTVVSQIVPIMDVSFVESQGNQVHEVFEALERENTVRAEYSTGTDIWYSLEDLKQGAKGNIREIEPGRLVKLFLGETGVSRFFYTGVLLDALPETGPFCDQFCVLYFLKIVLDSSHSGVSWTDIMNGMYCHVKQVAPVEIGDETDIPVTFEDDLIEGIKHKKLVHQVGSVLTGSIYVEDVIYVTDPPKDVTIRRLCFERTESLVHSEAPLFTKAPNEASGEVENNKVPAASRKWKKGKPKQNDSDSDSHASSGELKVEADHKILIMGFHKGVIAGLLLFSIHSKRTTLAGGLVNIAILGLGAGILPMFMKDCLPSLQIEVVELDTVVLKVATEYFGFKEDERLKVNPTEATLFVREKAYSKSVLAEGRSNKVDVLIIDVGSSDPSSGLVSPEADFVEESFLWNAKDSLSEKGLFIFKLVTRYSSVRGAVHSKLRTVFRNLYHFYADRDFVEIIFALKKDDPVVAEDKLAEACDALARSLESNNHDWVKSVLHDSKLIKPLPS